MGITRPSAAAAAQPGYMSWAEHTAQYSPHIDRLGRLRNVTRGWLWGGATASFIILAILALSILPLILLVHRVVVIIPPGHVGVMYRPFGGGTQVDEVYPEGLHIVAPYNYITTYDARVEIVTHKLDVLTNRGLPLELDLAIRYHTEYELVGMLQRAVGPDYLNKVVIPKVESVLRRNIGQHEPEDIYTNKEGILTAIIKRAIEETSQNYVTIDDIIIREVHLPPEIVDAINQKLVYQQQAAAYEYRLAAERAEVTRKQIEAGGIKDYQKIIAETLNDQTLRWQGIVATQELAKSNNSKVVIIGAGDHGLPLILGQQ